MANCWVDTEHIPHYWYDGSERCWCDGSGRDYDAEDAEDERDRQEELENG